MKNASPLSPAGLYFNRMTASVGSGHLSLLLLHALRLFVVMLFSGGLAVAEVHLPNIFGNNMVIQRGESVRVWGTGKADSKVNLSMGKQRVIAETGPDGTWQVTLKPFPAGGPYTLTVNDGDSSVVITNVMCGDLWLCSGQSNMQWPVKDVSPTEQKSVLRGNPHLRLCSVAKKSSGDPQSQAEISWQPCAAGAASNFSAVAVFFATELLKDPALAHVPIGLVDSSFGGTTCEGWIPQPALAKFAPGELHESMFGIKPAELFNGMIAPLGPTKFKGVLWYQGESNSAHPSTYPALLGTLIYEWRKQFDQPQLPFFVIQLPEYANLWEGYYWPWIREQQAKAVDMIPNTTLVVSLQTTDGFNLHPQEKQEIGRRTSLQARRVAYGEQLVASGPKFESAAIESSAIRVKFDTSDGLAVSGSGEVSGFAVAGADGDYHFAKAVIDGSAVLVSSEDIAQPQTVRYAWGGMPQANLVNRSGLPTAPFRTDSLVCSNVELQKQRVNRRVATPSYEAIIDANGTVTSLLMKGAQFLSNESGTAGGSSIPGFWGQRMLTQIKEIGPNRLSCADNEVTLQMIFLENSLQWKITNHGKETVKFQLALSPHIQSPVSIRDGKAALIRGRAILEVTGFESVTNTPTGAVLSVGIEPGSIKSIELK